MRIKYDPTKRQDIFRLRGLYMADTPKVFDSDYLTVEDERLDYGEVRRARLDSSGSGWWFWSGQCEGKPCASSA